MRNDPDPETTIRDLIDQLRQLAPAKGIRVKGVRVGADIFHLR